MILQSSPKPGQRAEQGRQGDQAAAPPALRPAPCALPPPPCVSLLSGVCVRPSLQSTTARRGHYGCGRELARKLNQAVAASGALCPP